MALIVAIAALPFPTTVNHAAPEAVVVASATLRAGDASAWTNVSYAVAPPAMAGSTLAFSSRQGLFVLFGGWNGEVLNGTWVFDSVTQTWSKVYTPRAPLGRGDAAFVYDSRNDVFLLFGGWFESSDEIYTRLGDTWAFYLSNRTWSELRPSVAPSNRSDSAIAYDIRDGIVLLFGGFDGSRYLGDAWAYSFGNNTWFPRPSAIAPPMRADGRMVYDEADDLFFLFGGNDYSGPNFTFHHLGDMWEYKWETNAWQQLTMDVAPGARDYSIFAYDPDAARLLLVGGYGERTILGDTWIFALRSSTWSALVTDEAPPPRFAGVGGYDTHEHLLVLFGGLGNEGLRADTWFLQPSRATSPAIVIPSLTPQQEVLGILLFAVMIGLVAAGRRRPSDGTEGDRLERRSPMLETEIRDDERS